MRLLSLFAVLILCLAGCSRGGGKSLVGEWAGEKGNQKSLLRLAQDKTFLLIASNDAAAGIQSGTYEQTGDLLKLHLVTPGPAGTVDFKYRWIGADKIAMKPDMAGSEEQEFHLSGPGPKTANGPSGSPGPGGSPSAATSEALKDAQETALSVTCLSNMKQLGIGNQMYANDWDGVLPQADWSTELTPYLKNDWAYTCPTLRKNNEKGGYAMDSRLVGMKLKDLSAPQTIIIFFESITKSIGSADAQTSLLVQPRHDGKINAAYVDGHAAVMAHP